MPWQEVSTMPIRLTPKTPTGSLLAKPWPLWVVALGAKRIGMVYSTDP